MLPFTLTKKDICFNPEIKVVFGLGFPIAFQDLLVNISFLILCSIVNNIGLEASSGYGIAQKVINFVMLIPSALMQSMSAFIAQNVGAGKEDRARKAMRTGKTLPVMLQGISASFLVRVPFSYLFSLKENVTLVDIGIAVPLASVYGIVFFTIYYIIYTKQRKKEITL